MGVEAPAPPKALDIVLERGAKTDLCIHKPQAFYPGQHLEFRNEISGRIIGVAIIATVDLHAKLIRLRDPGIPAEVKRGTLIFG